MAPPGPCAPGRMTPVTIRKRTFAGARSARPLGPELPPGTALGGSLCLAHPLCVLASLDLGLFRTPSTGGGPGVEGARHLSAAASELAHASMLPRMGAWRRSLFGNVHRSADILGLPVLRRVHECGSQQSEDDDRCDDQCQHPRSPPHIVAVPDTRAVTRAVRNHQERHDGSCNSHPHGGEHPSIHAVNRKPGPRRGRDAGRATGPGMTVSIRRQRPQFVHRVSRSVRPGRR
jgi:hypothetical protein